VTWWRPALLLQLLLLQVWSRKQVPRCCLLLLILLLLLGLRHCLCRCWLLLLLLLLQVSVKTAVVQGQYLTAPLPRTHVSHHPHPQSTGRADPPVLNSRCCCCCCCCCCCLPVALHLLLLQRSN
jgi:hypothetical protein